MATSSQIEAMTGGRTKIIWAAATTALPNDGNYYYDQLDPLYQLRGFDTQQGSATTILPGPQWCQRPRLTPDGNRVLYSARTSTWGPRQTWIVDWTGTNKRQICGGGAGAPFNGEVLDAWRDPASGKVYAVISAEKSGNYLDVYIVNIDDVADRRLIYSHSTGIQTFEISDDGMVAGVAGAQKVGKVTFTSPAGGTATYTQMWTASGNACNAGIGAGSSGILMHLHDNHQSVVVYPTMAAGAGVQVSVLSAPSMNNGTIWMPRWSMSDPRIFTMIAPFTNSSWAFTGTTSRIVMGKFSADYRSVEGWLVISTGSNYDAHGCVWIEKGSAPAVSITSFSASPATIAPGGSAVLSWSVANATGVTIDHGVGTVSSNATTTVTPTVTTTYTLTASNAGGQKTATATVTVSSSVSIASFTASPSQIAPGDSSILSWNVVSADSVKIDPGIGAVAASGSAKVKPSASTVYTLSAYGRDGPKSGTATVTVTGAFLPPKFTIVSPRAGDVWEGGKTYSIQWTAENAPDAVLQYTFDDGLSWESLPGLEALHPGDAQWGATRWSVPDTTTQCKVAISTYNLAGRVESASFTLRKSGSANVPDRLTGRQTSLRVRDCAVLVVGRSGLCGSQFSTGERFRVFGIRGERVARIRHDRLVIVRGTK